MMHTYELVAVVHGFLTIATAELTRDLAITLNAIESFLLWSSDNGVCRTRVTDIGSVEIDSLTDTHGTRVAWENRKLRTGGNVLWLH